MSHSLWPHGLQCARLPCPSLSPRVCSNLCPLKSVMLSNYLIPCHPLLLLPIIFPSIRVFTNESALCIKWLKYLSFSISPSNEYSGLNSFRIDWFDLLAVQGTLKSLLQHYSLKVSVLQCSAFLIVQLSHAYMCDVCWSLTPFNLAHEVSLRPVFLLCPHHSVTHWPLWSGPGMGSHQPPMARSGGGSLKEKSDNADSLKI